MFSDALQPKYYDIRVFEAKAKWFRDRYAHGIIPVPVELIIERDLGINLDAIEGLQKSIRTDAYITGDFQTIYVDSKEYMDERFENRLRFSLAHELGHLIFHSDIYRRLNVSTIDQFLSIQDRLAPHDYRNLEWQANQFAGHLLVPTNLLCKKYLEAFRVIDAVPSKPGKQGFDTDRFLVDDYISSYFGVSRDVILRRLGDETERIGQSVLDDWSVENKTGEPPKR